MEMPTQKDNRGAWVDYALTLVDDEEDAEWVKQATKKELVAEFGEDSGSGEPSEAVATGFQEHPVGVGVECPYCGAETLSTWPFEHCWRCGNREWSDS